MSESNSSQTLGITIDEKNILLNLEADDRTEVIRKLGGLLFDSGFVKDTYVQAVLDREVVFPTGLQATLVGIAIPHTDTEHVLRSAIAIATLGRPVIFKGMGMPDTDIPVTLVMMLAISDPKKVIPVLRSVLFILENADVLEAIMKASTEAEIKQAVESHIQAMAIVLSSEESREVSH